MTFLGAMDGAKIAEMPERCWMVIIAVW